ncbi:hypothetical protein M1446_00210 [Candidatus Dependentiae bacterium]|nr:hypothetical protein [Candidatus Dependentiae bacterium]
MNKLVLTFLVSIIFLNISPCERRARLSRTVSCHLLRCYEDDFFSQGIHLLQNAHTCKDEKSKIIKFKHSFINFLLSGDTFMNKFVHKQLPPIFDFLDEELPSKEKLKGMHEEFAISEKIYRKVKDTDGEKLRIISSHLQQIIETAPSDFISQPIKQKYENFLRQVNVFRVIKKAIKKFNRVQTEIGYSKGPQKYEKKFKEELELLKIKFLNSAIKTYLALAREYLQYFPDDVDLKNFQIVELITRLCDHALFVKVYPTMSLLKSPKYNYNRNQYLKLNNQYNDAYLKCIEFRKKKKKEFEEDVKGSINNTTT